MSAHGRIAHVIYAPIRVFNFTFFTSDHGRRTLNWQQYKGVSLDFRKLAL